VDDDRESPTYVLWEKLLGHGAEVAYYDPYCPVVRPTREHPQFAGIASVDWDDVTAERFDLAVIATAHDCVDHTALAEHLPLVIDTRGTCPPHPRVVKA
jgi:UDP-N-acetyl-D-glucosamine dehydrogenase